MESTSSSYSWLIILFTILIGILSIRLLLSYLFSIVLPSLTIKSIRLNSLRDITWSPSTSSSPSSSSNKKKSTTTGLNLLGIKISILKISWNGLGSKNCNQNNWLVLKITGLNIFIPRSFLLSQRTNRNRNRSNSSASNNSDRSTSSTTFVGIIPSSLSRILNSSPTSIRIPLSRSFRIIRKKLIHPSLILISTICTKLTAFLSLLALEVDLTIELEDVLIFKGILTAGIEVIKGEESRIGGWIGLEKLKISEPLRASGAGEEVKEVVLSALCMKERIIIRGSAPLDPTTGIGGLVSSKGGCFRAGKSSVKVEINFTEGQNGVQIRMYEIKRILENIEDIVNERKKLARLPMESNYTDEEDEEEEEENEGDENGNSENLFFYLQSISLSLPKFIISAHYNTPIHILAIQPNRPLPQSVGFVLTVNGIEGKIIMGGTSDEDGVKKDHKDWIGKSRDLGIRANFGWKEIEGRVKIDGSEEDILPDSAKAFTIGTSTLNVTSTWLPPNLISKVNNTDHYPSLARNFNDETVVLEGSVGVLRGHATFETLDSAVRIFNARPRSQRRTFFSESPSSESKFIRGFPRLIGTITAEGIEIRIQAPTPLSPRSKLDNKHFYRNWSSPDVFCISFPNGSLNFGGEYMDRSIIRTDSDRRQIKRLSKKKVEAENEVSLDRQFKSKSQEWLPDDVLGIPPPPPLLHSQARIHQIKKSNPAIDTHLDIYSLQYSMRFNLTCDLLNVFILATNDGTSDSHDATSWLDGSAILPSDPIRLDIFTLGPIELSSWHKLLGSEFIPPHQFNPIASLDIAAHTGEINVLVEEIGVDLWRPPVMSSLKDLASSFASAAAPSSLRTPSSYPTPSDHKPIVNLLPLEVALYLSIASIDFRIAGSDPMNDGQTCRGVAGRARGIILDYILQDSLRPGIIRYPFRQSLDLREDIRVEANANIAENPGIRQALFKITASQITLDPVINANTRISRGGHVSQKPSMDGGDIEAEEDWELRNRAHISDLAKRRKSILPNRTREASKGILNIPELSFRMKISNRKDEAGIAKDEIIISLETEAITARISLFNIYLCLVAISSVRALDPYINRSVPLPTEDVTHPSQSKRPQPLINLRVEITDMNVYIDLPTDVKLFLHIRRLRLQHSVAFGIILEWDSCLLAGESPTAAPKWEDLLRLRITSITARKGEDGGLEIVIASDTARLRIPFRYFISKIIDNGANLVKATKQLIHQHIWGKFDSILEPHQEEAKKLPKIEINIKMFAIEIQDDPFETKLNIIWRAGYEEQSARQERRAAFEEKVDAIRKMEAEGEDDSDEESEGYPSRKAKFTGRHSIGIEEARYDLRAYDSSHWVKRMRNAIAEQGRREEALTRRLYGVRHASQQRPDSLLPVELLPTSRSAPLARATFHGLKFVVSKHSYPPDKLPDFLYEVGKGLPRDTKFTLLVPLHFSWKMDEVKCQLRDYPLPLLTIPPVGGDDDDSTWECESDFVIAEEIGGPESVRRVPCVIVPAQLNSGQPIYTITVPRSAMTVKTYATPIIRINTPEATRIGWGNSVAPAIQDVARVIDSLSKPSPDPSDRLGFWDKIRLQLHWQVKVLFEGEGPLHFHLKGTRDPYALMGFGAGFSKSWRGNVKILLGLPNPDQEFMQVESDEYILGIPNLRDYVDTAATGLARDPTENDDRSTQHSSGYGNGNSKHHRLKLETDFVKVCAKFINGVRWGMGAVLERACTSDCALELCRNQTPFHRQCRFFTFKPHWDVTTRTAETAKGSDGVAIDSFKSFRSDFIHFSISLTSPLSLASTSNDQNTTSPEASDFGETGYNSLHFSPQASTHFWAWWKLFDGTMSLPIRQGKLFPSAQPPTKKFGKHCATIKYRFSLAPLFLSHTYKQESWEEWANGQTSLLGVKGKVARFRVDLHQREQEDVIRRPNSTESKTVLHKAFSRAYVDCEGVDLRVISAVFQEPEKRETIPTNLDIDFDDIPLPRKNQSIADDELDWVDLDDFVDAVYTIPDRNPQLQVLPFLVCPRFTYRRQTDGKGSAFGQNEPSEDDAGIPQVSGPKSKFGKEPSHTCLMGSAEETITVQIECARKRLAELQKEVKSNEKETKDGPKSEVRNRISSISKIIARMEQVQTKLRGEAELSTDKTDRKSPLAPTFDHEDDGEDNGLPYIATRFYEEGGEWENRYMIHNPNFQITNATRDILLKYYYSSRERKGFVYHISASAIKFIRDLTKEHEKKHHRQSSRKKMSEKTPGRKNTVLEESQETNRLLDELVNGLGKSFWATSETDSDKHKTFADPLDINPDSLADSLPESFEQQSGHLVLFIKPQIALQSDVDDKSIIILTAFRAELKTYSIIDSRTPDDPVNAHVLDTTFTQLQGLQAFYPREGVRSNNGNLFVPLETLIDLRIEPWGFDRVVPRTTAYVRYDKFNQLRMSAKGQSSDNLGLQLDSNHFQMGTDRVSVEFEKFSASANPDHFGAIYNVVTDLLLYSDPLQKSRSKKLEELVYTRDFSDLVRAIDAISSIQERLRSLQHLGQQYQVHLDELDEDGRLELFYGRAEFVRLSNELNLVVEAITRAQDFNRVNRSSSKSVGVQFEARAPEIVWHMLDKTDIPFAKFSVNGVAFSWISKKDSSVSNRLIIKDLKALNSSPNQIFAEIIAKSEKDSNHELYKTDIFAVLQWDALAPVGGISIVEQFQIHLHPVRLQLEHRVGRQILNYIFSQRRKATDLPPREEPIKPSRPSLAPSSTNSSYTRSNDSLPLSKNSSRSHLPENRSSTALAPSSASFSALGRTTSITEAWIADSSLEEGLDAVEMRGRAALYRTFLLVEFSSTTFYLTYRSEKEDHSRLPDVYNIVYTTPSIQHHGKTWSYMDLLDSLKRDIIKATWSQKGALLGQFLSAAHRKLPLHDQRQQIGSSFKNRFNSLKLKETPRPSVVPQQRPSPLRKPISVSSLPTRPAVPKLDFSTLSRSEIAANFSRPSFNVELSEEPESIDDADPTEFDRSGTASLNSNIS